MIEQANSSKLPKEARPATVQDIEGALDKETCPEPEFGSPTPEISTKLAHNAHFSQQDDQFLHKRGCFSGIDSTQNPIASPCPDSVQSPRDQTSPIQDLRKSNAERITPEMKLNRHSGDLADYGLGK